eukprot:TRINITY_DN4815_c1_g1_i4.p1 TRINITY_DN4815_c1_g1~~TRINITY_DN4815_c1_g1_i4.p1  ORF type:complete len:428 (+),score=66.78 TRINITY_DN4815_c1_g1_i4:53-1285(+)
MGSSLALGGVARLGANVALVDIVRLGSSLALRSFSRIAASLACCGTSRIEASLPLRFHAYFSTALLLTGRARSEPSPSAPAFARTGSSPMARGSARSRLSTSAFACTRSESSSLSRALSRLEPSALVASALRLGAPALACSLARSGSTLSPRSFARAEAALFVLEVAHLESSLPSRSTLLNDGLLTGEGDTRVANLSGANTYVQYSPLEVNFYASGARQLSLNHDGGVLHGLWMVDMDAGGMSDRRLKENIRPLVETLRRARALAPASPAPSSSASTGRTRPKVGDSWHGEAERPGVIAEWLLRQLKPVAYNYRKRASEEQQPRKATRFGFIADDIGKILPEVERQNVGGSGSSGIIYQDLVAVLVYALQDLGSGLRALAPRMLEVELRLERRRRWKAKRVGARGAEAVS